MRLKRFAEKLWGSPCSIVLAFPTPNAAEESATPKSSAYTTCSATDAAVNERTRFAAVRRRNDKTWVFGFSAEVIGVAGQRLFSNALAAVPAGMIVVQ
jgi:hypothetical protein